MANEFKVIFLGICLVAQMSIGGDPNARRIILPNLDGTDVVAGHTIPRHRGFIMFPAAGYVTSDGGWLKPPEVVKNGVRYGFYFLDGDEITLSHVAEKVDAASHHANVFHIASPAICPTFGVLADKYATGTDPDEKKAHFDVTYGKLRIKRMFAGMRATELTMHSDQANLKVTATSYRYGTSRSVTVLPGSVIWIGNMTDSFFMKPAPPPPPPAHPHFLAYYMMSRDPNTCHWVPADDTSSASKDITVMCSTGGYP